MMHGLWVEQQVEMFRGLQNNLLAGGYAGHRFGDTGREHSL